MVHTGEQWDSESTNELPNAQGPRTSLGREATSKSYKSAENLQWESTNNLPNNINNQTENTSQVDQPKSPIFRSIEQNSKIISTASNDDNSDLHGNIAAGY